MKTITAKYMKTINTTSLSSSENLYKKTEILHNFSSTIKILEGKEIDRYNFIKDIENGKVNFDIEQLRNKIIYIQPGIIFDKNNLKKIFEKYNIKRVNVKKKDIADYHIYDIDPINYENKLGLKSLTKDKKFPYIHFITKIKIKSGTFYKKDLLKIQNPDEKKIVESLIENKLVDKEILLDISKPLLNKKPNIKNLIDKHFIEKEFIKANTDEREICIQLVLNENEDELRKIFPSYILKEETYKEGEILTFNKYKEICTLAYRKENFKLAIDILINHFEKDKNLGYLADFYFKFANRIESTKNVNCKILENLIYNKVKDKKDYQSSMFTQFPQIAIELGFKDKYIEDLKYKLNKLAPNWEFKNLEIGLIEND